MDPSNFIDFLKRILPEKTQEMLLAPAADSLGKTAGDIVEVTTAPISLPAKYLAAHIRSLKDKIDNKFSLIEFDQLSFNEENFNKLLKFSNDLQFSLDSEEIRNMFANLVVKSFVKSDQDALHPAFSSIIRDLTPLDARNLIVIYQKYPSTSFPLVDYRETAPNGSFNTVKQNVFLENNEEDDLDSQILSIENLERLKLLLIENNFKWDSGSYEKFNLTDFFIKQKHILNENKIQWEKSNISEEIKNGWVCDISINKKTCELTSFGKLFCSICLD